VKAAVVERPGILKVYDVPMPQLGKYDVLCKGLYATTCTGTDTLLIEGRFHLPIRYPTILGHESVGQVLELGSKVRYFSVGDLVARIFAPPTLDGKITSTWGGFVEYGIAKDYRAMRDDGLHNKVWQPFCAHTKLTYAADPAYMPMIITWRETLSYITRMGLRSGMIILIIGSGGNALAFSSHAAYYNAKRIVMIGNSNRAEIAFSAGVDQFYGYKNDQYKELRAGNVDKFDMIIDTIGGTDTSGRYLSLLKSGGVLGVYGTNNYATCSLNPNHASGSFVVYNDGYVEAEAHDTVVNMIESGHLKADLWIDADCTYPLVNVNDAFQAVIDRKCIKALLKLT